MSADAEGKVFSQPKPQATTSRNYLPTLYIGLGGTGKDVLMRLRKRLYEQSGPVDRPYLRFLFLDTDMQSWCPAKGTEAEYEPVKPKAGDFIACQIGEANFYEVFDLLEKQNDPRFVSWLKPALRGEGHQAVNKGAGTHRQFGRVAFMLKYEDIRKAIQLHLLEMLDEVGKMTPEQAKGVIVEPDTFEVVIVTSLAGGTGAGMFLDIAYLVKDIIASHPTLRGQEGQSSNKYVSLIAVLPTVFEKNTEGRPYAKFQQNAYAALLELEHYGTNRTGDDMFLGQMNDEKRNKNRIGFYAPWADGKFIEGQGWDVCYLVDNVNPHRMKTPMDFVETCQMIADYLFLDFQRSEFAKRKRSNRCNLSQYQRDMIGAWVRNPNLKQAAAGMDKTADVVFAARNGCAFSSFGLSEISFSRERVYRAAAYLLASRLVLERWLGPMGEVTPRQYEGMVREDFYQNPDADGYSFLPETLLRKLYQIRGEATNYYLLGQQDCEAAKNVHFSEGSGRLRKVRERHDGLLTAPQGAAYKVGQENAGSMAGNMLVPVGPLRARVEHTARGRADLHGVAVTRELLKQYGQATIAVQNQMKPAAKGQDVGVLRLEEADGLNPPARKLAQRIEFPRACHAVETAVLGNYRATASPFVDSLMQKVREYLLTKDKAKPAELSRVRTLAEYFDRAAAELEKLGARLRKRFHEFSAERGTDRCQFLSPDWEEADYREKTDLALKGNNAVGPNAAGTGFDWLKLEKLVFTQLREAHSVEPTVDSLTPLLDQWFDRYRLEIADADLDQIGEALQTACYHVLNEKANLDLTQFYDGCVVDLLQGMKEPDRDSRLQKFIRTSSPYLPMEKHAQQVMTRNYDATLDNLLGMQADSNAQSRENEKRLLDELKDAAKQASAHLTVFTPCAGDRTSLVLCREAWGVPLQFYSFLRHLHEAYMQRGADVDACHINTYQVLEDMSDVRAIESDVYAQISQNVETVILAMMTGVISRGPGEAYWIRVPDAYATVAKRLGTHVSRIIKVACEDERIRKHLQDIRSDWESNAPPKKWAMVYASALWTYLETLVEFRQGADDRYVSPLRNCVLGLLRHCEGRLKVKPEGQKWLRFLKPAKPDDDRAAREHAKRLFNILKEERKILVPPSEAVPICEIKWDAAESFALPDGPPQPAASPPADAAVQG